MLLLARYMLSSCPFVRPFVSLYARLSQVGIVSKQLDESSLFLT